MWCLLADRLHDVNIGVTDTPPVDGTTIDPSSYTLCAHYVGVAPVGETVMHCDPLTWGRYIIVQLPSATESLTLCEVQGYKADLQTGKFLSILNLVCICFYTC